MGSRLFFQPGHNGFILCAQREQVLEMLGMTWEVKKKMHVSIAAFKLWMCWNQIP